MAKAKADPTAAGSKQKYGSVVKHCNCDSTYQDQKYGEHQRVFNLGKANATCTVCGKTA